MQLALLAPVIAGRQRRNDFLGGTALGQQSKAIRAVKGTDEGLGGNGAHPAANMWNGGADGEETACHRHGQMAGLRITCDNRPGHGYLPIA